MSFDLTFANLYALRDRAKLVADQTAQHVADRERIASAPLHADDMAAKFRRGVDVMAADFEARLATSLADPKADVIEVLREGASVYFMRELAVSKVPALIKRLHPNAGRGVKLTDRQAALDDIERQMRELDRQREEIRVGFSIEAASLREGKADAILHRDPNQTKIEREEERLVQDLIAIRAAQEERARQPASAG